MTQLTRAQFEDKLSFWVNGSLPESEAEEMSAFLEANPGLNGMYRLEVVTQKGVDRPHSPFTTDESWDQLRVRWKPVGMDTKADGFLSVLKRRLGIGEAGNTSGWQVGFSLAAAVCVVQAVALLQLGQDAEAPWSETRSGNSTISHNIRAKPLPQSTTAEVLAGIRASEAQIVGGPNGDGELLMLSSNVGGVDLAIEKLAASGLFEYVLIVKTSKQVKP